ncbi:MAG: hypothetical protein IJ323_02655 [Clostridia bacterium]|nr:hypothetical protein [Clostridia bacterium]
MEKITSVFYIFTAVLFLFFPKARGESATVALLALKNVVLATLFPMMVLTRAISGSALMDKLGNIIGKSRLWKRLSLSPALIPVVLCGIISGFPASARQIERMVNEKTITPEEGEKALCLSSAPSPAFVIAVVGRTPLHGSLLFLFSLAISYLVTCHKKSKASPAPPCFSSVSLSSALTSSVTSAVAVGGSIVFFTLITSLFNFLPYPLPLIISALSELGSGAVTLLSHRILLSFLTGWGGISALCQIKSEAPRVKTGLYVRVRLFSGTVLALLEGLGFSHLF